MYTLYCLFSFIIAPLIVTPTTGITSRPSPTSAVTQLTQRIQANISATSSSIVTTSSNDPIVPVTIKTLQVLLVCCVVVIYANNGLLVDSDLNDLVSLLYLDVHVYYIYSNYSSSFYASYKHVAFFCWTIAQAHILRATPIN